MLVWDNTGGWTDVGHDGKAFYSLYSRVEAAWKFRFRDHTVDQEEKYTAQFEVIVLMVTFLIGFTLHILNSPLKIYDKILCTDVPFISSGKSSASKSRLIFCHCETPTYRSEISHQNSVRQNSSQTTEHWGNEPIREVFQCKSKLGRIVVKGLNSVWNNSFWPKYDLILISDESRIKLSYFWKSGIR